MQYLCSPANSIAQTYIGRSTVRNPRFFFSQTLPPQPQLQPPLAVYHVYRKSVIIGAHLYPIATLPPVSSPPPTGPHPKQCSFETHVTSYHTRYAGHGAAFRARGNRGITRGRFPPPTGGGGGEGGSECGAPGNIIVVGQSVQQSSRHVGQPREPEAGRCLPPGGPRQVDHRLPPSCFAVLYEYAFGERAPLLPHPYGR